LNKQDAIDLIEDVASQRGLSLTELIGSEQRGRKVSAARRAIAMIAQDKWGFKLTSNHCMGLGDLAHLLGCARSSLHHAVRNWQSKEGSQDADAEEAYRAKGYFLPKTQEPFENLVKRVLCKTQQNKEGDSSECLYWHS